jgi:hypothetical protein
MVSNSETVHLQLGVGESIWTEYGNLITRLLLLPTDSNDTYPSRAVIILGLEAPHLLT